jgi:hypothetical protein
MRILAAHPADGAGIARTVRLVAMCRRRRLAPVVAIAGLVFRALLLPGTTIGGIGCIWPPRLLRWMVARRHPAATAAGCVRRTARQEQHAGIEAGGVTQGCRERIGTAARLALNPLFALHRQVSSALTRSLDVGMSSRGLA